MNYCFTKKDMDNLKKNQKKICISFYMKTLHANINKRMLFIEFKNYLTTIENNLLKLDMDKDEVKHFISKAKQFFKDNSANGLLRESVALFFSFNNFFSYILPSNLENKIFIGDTFYLEPLEIYLDSLNQHFYILALSQKKITLYYANPYEMEEVLLDNIPTNIDTFLADDEFNSNIRFRSSVSQSNNKNSTFFYSVGDKKADSKKNQILRYYSVIDNSINKQISQKKVPLVLVGVKYLTSIYKMINTYSNLYDVSITGSPDTIKKSKIYKEVLKVLDL